MEEVDDDWKGLQPWYSRTSTNGQLSTTAIFFLVDSPYIDSCLNLSTTAIFFCSKVSAVERFNCIWKHVSLTVIQNSLLFFVTIDLMLGRLLFDTKLWFCHSQVISQVP